MSRRSAMMMVAGPFDDPVTMGKPAGKVAAAVKHAPFAMR